MCSGFTHWLFRHDISQLFFWPRNEQGGQLMLSLGNKYYILLLLYIITIIRQKTAILKNCKVTTYVYKSGLLMRCNMFRTPFWYASVYSRMRCAPASCHRFVTQQASVSRYRSLMSHALRVYRRKLAWLIKSCLICLYLTARSVSFLRCINPCFYNI